MQTRNLIGALIVMLFITQNLFSQDTNQVEPLKSIKSKSVESQKSIESTNNDSIDNSEFCMQQQKEFNRMRKLLSMKLDSLKREIQLLRQKHPGYNYHIEFHETSQSHFDWKGCFQSRPRKCISHGEIINLDSDWVELELRVSREEDKSHFNSDGSSGWTIYYDDIERSAK